MGEYNNRYDIPGCRNTARESNIQFFPNFYENYESFKSQIMHILVHHAQIPLSSSLIIVLIVSLSMILGYRFKITWII